MSGADVLLLGGAQRVRTRVRGFAPWTPRGATLELLEQVRGVLGEYEDYLSLTIRQIFYRLVGAHDYEKTERAYGRLCEHLNRARRARIIPMDVIRDDGGVISEPHYWEGTEHFLRTIHAMAKNFKLDHSAGQKSRQVVICEAAGMVPQLERVAHPLGAVVMSGGGFDSLTDKYNFAAQLDDRPTDVFDLGDHDPSGSPYRPPCARPRHGPGAARAQTPGRSAAHQRMTGFTAVGDGKQKESRSNEAVIEIRICVVSR